MILKIPSILCYLLLAANSLSAAPALTLHPENPHYFRIGDKSAVLITSAEHYGMLLNLDFDYVKYLETLAADGMNLTRIFSGAYVEPEGAFNIAKNTLAPKPGRFLCPWARSSQPGYANGGNKFDLDQWDPAWFERLKAIVKKAGELGIVVEFTFFCPMYEDPQWKLSPMNIANNINGVGDTGKHEVYNLDPRHGLQALQEKLVRKVIAELKGTGLLIYEICNEPYFGGVTDEWQRRIADVIMDAQKDFPEKNLISWNVANGSQKIMDPHPGISVFNFHYANPPDAVALNFELNKVIGDNETGFKGTADDHYRMEAWEFILAGGALFNHLDYSFAAGHEDGSFAYPPSQPGGGNAGFRQQMKRLKDFIHGFDFIKMKPSLELLKEKLPEKARCQILATPGKEYAVYLKARQGTELKLEIQAGSWTIGWLDVVSGRQEMLPPMDHPGGAASFKMPQGMSEAALSIRRRAAAE